MQPFRHPGQITRGVGKLSPQVWRGLTDVTDWVSRHIKELEEVLKTHRKAKRTERKTFLAKLTHAKRVNTNQYIYAWVRVQLSGIASGTAAYSYAEDANVSSTESSDAYANAAINVMESGNTDTLTAPGTDTAASTFPEETFFMNPIGGHASHTEGTPPRQPLNTSVALLVSPVVVMHAARNVTTGGVRYFFCNSNAMDGDTCPA